MEGQRVVLHGVRREAGCEAAHALVVGMEARNGGVDGQARKAQASEAEKESSRGEEAGRTVEFIEVVAARADDRIEIEIGDAVVRVPRDVDATQLARVLEVLAAR